jgi:hypothetical protein
MGKEHALCALPLILSRRELVRLKLPSAEVRNGVDDDPRDTTSKVHNLWGSRRWERDIGECETHTDLMEEETGKSGGNDRVTDQEVPADPLSLDPIERGKVGAGVKLLGGILVEDGGGAGSRVKGHDREGKGTRWRVRGTARLLVFSTHLQKIGPLYSSHDRYASLMPPSQRRFC